MQRRTGRLATTSKRDCMDVDTMDIDRVEESEMRGEANKKL
jgi:hypothetical protein